MDKITECSLALGLEEFSANRHGTLQVLGKGILFSPSWGFNVSSPATQDYGGLRLIAKCLLSIKSIRSSAGDDDDDGAGGGSSGSRRRF